MKCRRVEVVCEMVDANWIKEGFAPQTMVTLDDATLIGTRCGEDILQCCVCEQQPQPKFQFQWERNIALLGKCVITACVSFWIATSQRTKVKAVAHMDSACLSMCMEFHAPIANDCWSLGFGQRFRRSRCECFLLLSIPLRKAVEVA